MNFLAISCSPRRHGNTEDFLDEVIKGARHEGANTELFTLAGKTIHPCDGCAACWKTGKCHIKDDMQELYPKMLAADGIVFGVPVYHYSMIAQAKIVLDRTYAMGEQQAALANKVGGVVAIAASLGIVDVLKDLYFYYVSMQMLPANYVAAYANKKGDTQDLKKAIEAAFNLGRQVVLLANKKFEYPKEIEGAHHGYGTWIK